MEKNKPINKQKLFLIVEIPHRNPPRVYWFSGEQARNWLWDKASDLCCVSDERKIEIDALIDKDACKAVAVYDNHAGFVFDTLKDARNYFKRYNGHKAFDVREKIYLFE